MNQKKYDVVIIGGGVIGLCTAYYLSEQGASVAVLDGGEMGQGSSHGNAGYISPSHFIPLAAPGVFTQGLKWMFNKRSPLYIKPRLDPSMIRWSWHFARACRESVAYHAVPTLRDLLNESRELFCTLTSSYETEYDLEKKGLVVLFNTEKGMHTCEHEHELSNRFGVVSSLLNKEELKKLDPDINFNAQGGLYYPNDMHLKPDKLIQFLTSYVREKNVTLIPNTKINNFIKKENKITHAVTDKGSFAAEHFVLAAGTWSSELAKQLDLKMHLQAGKGYSVTVKNPEVKPKIPYIFLERRVAITPFADSLRFAGTMELAGLNLGINWPRVETILDSIPHYFSNVKRPVAQEHTVWAGLRPVTPDGLPYIGAFKQIPNLIAATGHAMLGVSLAPITGSIVCDMIQGKKITRDLTLLNPNRYD